MLGVVDTVLAPVGDAVGDTVGAWDARLAVGVVEAVNVGVPVVDGVAVLDGVPEAVLDGDAAGDSEADPVADWDAVWVLVTV